MYTHTLLTPREFEYWETGGYYSISGDYVYWPPAIRWDSWIEVKPNSLLYSIVDPSLTYFECCEYDENKTWLGFFTLLPNKGYTRTNEKARYVRVCMGIEKPSMYNWSLWTELCGGGNVLAELYSVSGDIYPNSLLLRHNAILNSK